ncbi:MAG: exodeoxyribonuclease VII large subunit [Pseudomonadota bacterium]
MITPSSAGRGRNVFTVARLNQEARAALESALGLVWVRGELSNIARPASGHLYFSLKDSRAQVRCAMFRQRNRSLRFRPENGLEVLVRARVGLYEPRGDFQLQVDHMEVGGEGALRLQFDALKTQLADEGLFDPATKKPLPALPTRIGVITSPSGAVIRDILNVLKRRFPSLPVRIYPVAVQGEAAAGQIVAALQRAARRQDCDVLVLARGGGSLEDLWPFNEEAVARAVHACPIPVVSAVGHETDVTIADFVADLRAPTPSAAAELIAPDRAELTRKVNALTHRATRAATGSLDRLRERTRWLEGRLQRCHPGQRLRTQAQRLDELDARLRRAVTLRLRSARQGADAACARLRRAAPLDRLARGRDRHAAALERLKRAMAQYLDARRARLTLAGRALDSLSPLSTLQRGYAIVTDGGGAIVHDATALAPGDTVNARLARGTVTATVSGVADDDSDASTS